MALDESTCCSELLKLTMYVSSLGCKHVLYTCRSLCSHDKPVVGHTVVPINSNCTAAYAALGGVLAPIWRWC